MCVPWHTSTQYMPTLRPFIPGATKIPSGSAATFVLSRYYSSFREHPFISWAILNLHSEEIDVLPGKFPLERRSELTVRADRDDVSQRLRTIKQLNQWEKSLKVIQLNTCLPKEAVNSLCHLGPGERSTSQRQTQRQGAPGLHLGLGKLWSSLWCG